MHKRHSETGGQEPRMGTKELKAAALVQGDREEFFTNDMQNNNPPREKLKKRDSNWLFHEAARLSPVL